ncbi:J domain-containing protein [Vampirovibrio sp.]|uniref:J domain-containing protein n=1 Tax=Vampirovibrio sp. TaxID=2717857 RepID=UPI0035937B3A
MKDYYHILQVHPEASQEVLNGAYRSLVKQFHPDKFHTHRKAAMNDKMREINEAYQVLSNAQTRTDYDRRYPGIAAKAKQSAPKSLQARIKSVLLWTLLSYLALTFFIKPLIGSPVAKLLILVALAYFFFRLYIKQKKRP